MSNTPIHDQLQAELDAYEARKDNPTIRDRWTAFWTAQSTEEVIDTRQVGALWRP